ncbi:MAG: hypothetical protein PVI15_05025 [Chromatiales bacterium]|jgi:hypothetical protein
MTDWESKHEPIGDGRVVRITLSRHGAALSFADVIEGWLDDPAFVRFHVSALAQTPFEAMFWEHPPLTRRQLDRTYECVLVDSPALAGVAPEPGAFREHFGRDAEPDRIVAFPNLGRDAWLVVPCPGDGDDADYAHLATFLRAGPPAQVEALFRHLGDSLAAHLGDDPIWVSTSGLGVYWLHIRLDARPKYYTYAPYRTRP